MTVLFQTRESNRLARKMVATRGRSVYAQSHSQPSADNKRSSTKIRSENEERSNVHQGGNSCPKTTSKTSLPSSHCTKVATSTRPSAIPTPNKNVANAQAGAQSVGLRGRRPLGVPPRAASGFGSAVASAESKNKYLAPYRKKKNVTGMRGVNKVA